MGRFQYDTLTKISSHRSGTNMTLQPSQCGSITTLKRQLQSFSCFVGYKFIPCSHCLPILISDFLSFDSRIVTKSLSPVSKVPDVFPLGCRLAVEATKNCHICDPVWSNGVLQDILGSWYRSALCPSSKLPN